MGKLEGNNLSVIGELQLFTIHDRFLQCVLIEVFENYRRIPLTLLVEMEKELNKMHGDVSAKERTFTEFYQDKWILFSRTFQANGGPMYLISISELTERDLGERLSAEESNSMQVLSEAIVRRFSHQFLNILTPISGTLQRLEQEGDMEDRAWFSFLNEEIDRGKAYLNHYYQLHQTTQTHPELVLIGDCLGGVVANLFEIYPEMIGRIDFPKELPDWTVMVDMKKLCLAIQPIVEKLFYESTLAPKHQFFCDVQGDFVEISFFWYQKNGHKDMEILLYLELAKKQLLPGGANMMLKDRLFVISLPRHHYNSPRTESLENIHF